ncbi:hypothetical protein P175DRAFT_0504490 [Aspergillus ochraceoroseus IBT 24754]|uniref:Peptidyl-tRNA hydrolase n=2 Tax=Aspergillus ochraceoroseus TaxID=138278 RepID=A0A2T5LN83_9EURO|nr:uncharacterized protein P175DRAFT_0504490 [Aspergillus ochraceoroseus IBT 24754]KKK13371.1 hypothetical protein AOCH_001816 [Aspergillus ochraceoroseus]PTU17745.1 hypothetical protein P175DRAFT_0504490 [Aspergillus ochraceoroseus IBT 24754]
MTQLKPPRRFLFIASIGNPHPYRSTRHSAGHILLDAVIPLLPARFPLVSTTTSTPLFYKTWRSPSYMNESGPKLIRQLGAWLSTTESEVVLAETVQGGVEPCSLRTFQPTLVILHDELEAPLGRVRVKRGGPEVASLRGHRGLISIMESLRGKGLYPPKESKEKNHPSGRRHPGNGGGLGLSILRIGVGIGRPDSRVRGEVADYVLAEMDAAELDAVRRAAGSVVDVLADEIYRV